jgi:hypothetical protein
VEAAVAAAVAAAEAEVEVAEVEVEAEVEAADMETLGNDGKQALMAVNRRQQR